MSAKSQRYWKKYGIDGRSERVEEQNVSFQVVFSWISSEFIYKILLHISAWCALADYRYLG